MNWRNISSVRVNFRNFHALNQEPNLSAIWKGHIWVNIWQRYYFPLLSLKDFIKLRSLIFGHLLNNLCHKSYHFSTQTAPKETENGQMIGRYTTKSQVKSILSTFEVHSWAYGTIGTLLGRFWTLCMELNMLLLSKDCFKVPKSQMNEIVQKKSTQLFL